MTLKEVLIGVFIRSIIWVAVYHCAMGAIEVVLRIIEKRRNGR